MQVLKRYYMEAIYLPDNGDGLKTGVGAAMDSDEETIKAFEGAKELQVPSEQSRFLIDLHDNEGDIVDTVLLDENGYSKITGEAALSESEYLEIGR